jgi:hypothetical protein
VVNGIGRRIVRGELIGGDAAHREAIECILRAPGVERCFTTPR